MGTLCFVLLSWAKGLQSDYDCYWLSLLIALDAQTVFRWWLWRQARR